MRETLYDEESMKVNKLDHISIAVRDLDAAKCLAATVSIVLCNECESRVSHIYSHTVVLLYICKYDIVF
jgi:hypothetical protein